MQLTSEDVLRYTRIALQWFAAFLTTHGAGATGSWIEINMGIIIGIITFLWTLYGNRINAKLAEIAKVKNNDGTPVLVVADSEKADAIPATNVISKDDVKVIAK